MMQDKSIRLKVHLALLLVSLIYGATFTVAKIAMPQYIQPFGFILLRVSVAAICILAFHQLKVKDKKVERTDLLPLFVSAIFGVAANMLLFFKGLSITTPINGAVLMLNTPIFVILFAAFWLKEKLSWYKVIGLLLAALGALTLMGGLRFNFGMATVLGDIFVTLNAIIYAFYLVYAKHLMKKYHPLTVTKYAFVFGFFMVLPFGFSELKAVEFSQLPMSIWMILLFVTIGSTFITYVLNAFALKHADSSLVGSYIYLQPVMAALIAVVTGHDVLTLEKLASMLVIFSGLFLASRNW